MNSINRWLPLLIGSGLAAVLLVTLMVVVPALAQGPGGGMMGGNGYGPGMMGGNGYGPGMMGYSQNFTGTTAYGCPGFGGGMMGGQGYGMMGMMDGGMMWNSNSPFFAADPLTLAEATEAIESYLTTLNDPNLELHEIMIFDNHAYAEIFEKDTGIGAMELLVDSRTKAVYPEMGPNMMWNLKYGMMSGNNGYGMMGMMRGMMGYANSTNPSAEMTVTAAEAVAAAQTYLDTNLLDRQLSVEAEAEPFYGYYTLHVSSDGQTVGMLSVNGYTQQVFLHTWHGKLLEMSEE
jgi:hypothetical protein